MNQILKIAALSAVLVASSVSADAKIKLPSFYTDNMIVQQNSMLTIPVVTDVPGQKVVVTPSWGKAVTATTDAEGRATLRVATPAAGGPYSLAVATGNDSLRLINILSGEVWLCSGQSNMEYPVNGWTYIMDHDRVIGEAHRPDIRLLQVRKNTSFLPKDDAEVNMDGWVECNSATMQDFSAIAYLFAVRMHDELGVPVGVIDTTWGGTPAEAWTSAGALGAVPGFSDEVAMLEKANGDRSIMEKEWQKLYERRLNQTNAVLPKFDKGVYQSGWPTMPVPGFFEDSVAPGLDGVMYAQTVLNLTADEASKPITLHLGAIDDEDITYLNGKEVARGAGFATERHYTIDPKYLREGDNVLTIHISDFGGEGGFRAVPGQIKAETSARSIPMDGQWAYKIGVDFKTLDPLPASVGSSSFPSVLYNAMLSPLHVMPIKGVLWYQGCANVGRAEQYEPLFQTMISDWRKLWGYDMPFYFVQLAGWLKPRALQPDSEWAALRNAQAKALILDNTSMVTAIDLGNPADIHPRNKQEVARRLAETALTRDYGKQYDYKMPVCTDVKTKGSEMLLTFDAPLAPKSVAVTGFIVGDANGNFAVAAGRMVNPTTIVLSAAEIQKPVAARYDWADYPGGNLYGANGLPVAPFATDK